MTMKLESSYKLLFMSKQVLRRGDETGQLCGGEECASSVCVLACGVAVSTVSTGGPLGSDSEEQLTISIVIGESSSLSTRSG